MNPGDVFDLEVFAKYEAPGATSNNVNALLSQLVSAFSLGVGTTPLDGAQAQSAFNDLFSAGPLITSSQWESSSPKAYLNYILLDENFELADFGFDQISTSGNQVGSTPVVPHDYLSLHVKVEQKGFLYVYLSNEQPTVTNVYFDDLKIVRYTSVAQVSDYYPFGLTFNSFSDEHIVANDYKFNSKEEQDELDLGWLDFGARMYMPEIGRWGVGDPLGDKASGWTPYRYGFDNPMRFIDPNGMFEYSNGYSTQDSRNESGSVSYSGSYEGNQGDLDQGTTASRTVIATVEPQTTAPTQTNTEGGGTDGSADAEQGGPGDPPAQKYDDFTQILIEINKWNPLAYLMDATSGYIDGTDRLGNPISKADATLSLAMAIPIGRFAKGGLILVEQGGKIIALTESQAPKLFAEMEKQLAKPNLTPTVGKSFVGGAFEETLSGVPNKTGPMSFWEKVKHVITTGSQLFGN